MTESDTSREILKTCKTIAVVGMSDKPHRPSHRVARYLLEHGYTIIPVNPRLDEVLGQPCYPSLRDIPGPVDMVDCFRRSEEMVDIATAAIAIQARVLWMQIGVVNVDARNLAVAAGLEVIMDRCTAIDHAQLMNTAL